MLNVAIFVFSVLMSSIPNGTESQTTIEDDVCEMMAKKEEENEMLRRSLETARTSLERKERLLKTYEEYFVIINLVKRLNQSSSTVKRNLLGVTTHNDRVYILCDYPNSIRVFEDRNQFHLLSEVQLTQTGWLNDMVYNEQSNCFYISDFKDKCIWKIEITEGNQTQVTQWFNGTTEPHTLSLSSNGHLLILRDSQSYFTSSRLDIYNGSDDQLIRRLQLPSDIKRPRHAIQTKTGEFLISHMLRERYGERRVISRVTSDGQTIIAQSNPRDESERLDDPLYLSLDSDDDLLFVADHENNRVDLFDSVSLDFRKSLLTRERNGIQGPRRLYYDKEKKQLIVGHSQDLNRNGVVDVYDIR